LIVGSLPNEILFYSILSQKYTIFPIESDEAIEKFLNGLVARNCVIFERTRTIQNSFLLSDLFSCDKRTDVLCADGTMVIELPWYEKNLDQTGEIDYDSVLKIYNFYSCVYLLNYVLGERKMSDQSLPVVVYLKKGTTYVAKQAKLIPSIGQSEKFDEFEGRRIKMSCGIIHSKKKESLLFMNGQSVTQDDVNLMITNM